MILKVPGFTTLKDLRRSGVLLEGGGAQSLSATWTSNSSSITFTASRVLYPTKTYTVLISEKNGFKIPYSGLPKNDPSMVVRVRLSLMGNTSHTAVLESQAVGTFKKASVLFSPAVPEAPSDFNFSFVHSADIKVSESIQITLLGFSGCGSCKLALDGQNPDTFSVEWVPAVFSFLFKALRDIPSGTVVQVTVTPTCDITIPSQGFMSGALISTTAEAGPVLPTAMNFTHVGQFLSSAVNYTKLSVDTNISISLDFTFNGYIGKSSYVNLEFPGFWYNWTYLNATLLLTGKHAQSFLPSLSYIPSLTDERSNGSLLVSLWTMEQFEPNTPVSLILSVNSGLYLPPKGLKANDPSILIWTNQTDAPMGSAASILISPAVGLFFSSLDFTNKRAGEISEISFSFSTSGRLFPGDSVVLSLPGFIRSNQSSAAAVIKGPNGLSFSASWISQNSTVVMSCLETLPPGRKDVVFSAVNSFRLPSHGSKKGSQSYTIRARTKTMGSLADVPILYSPAIGAVTSSSLYFSPAQAGSAATVTLSFSLPGALYPHDIIYLRLPGFSAGYDIAEAILSGPFAGDFWAYWSEREGLFKLTSLSYTAPTNLTLVFNSSTCPGIPADGFLSDHNFSIAFDAYEAPVEYVRVQDFQPIGAFLQSEVSFLSLDLSTNVKPGLPVWISCSFWLTGDISTGEGVFFQLPGLNGTGLGDRFLTVNGSAGDLFTGYFFENTSTLSFQAKSVLKPAMYTIALPPSNGLVLPYSGYYENDSSIQVYSNATMCPVLSTPVKLSQAVGFVSSTMQLKPAIAGQAADIIFEFALKEALYSSEVVLLELPGFVGEKGYVALYGTENASFSASWSNSSETLNITATQDLAAGLKVTLIIPRINGIKAPLKGLSNDQSISIGTSGRDIVGSQPILWTVVQNHSYIGDFHPSTLEYGSSLAGNPTPISVNFSLSCSLIEGDAIFLELSSFGGGSQSSLVLSGQDGGSFFGSWDACENLLTLVALGVVPTGFLQLTIDKTNGIQLPEHGLHSNDERLRISSNATYCPAPASSVTHSDSIISFVQSKVSFTPLQLQQCVEMALSFNMSEPLDVNDTLTVTLPGFSDPTNTLLALGGSNVNYFEGFWSTSTSSIEFRALNPIKAYSLVEINVSSSNCFKLPDSGLKPKSSGLAISISSVTSSAKDSPIKESPALGT